MINPLECFFSFKDHAALGISTGPGYNSIRLQLIPGDHYSACPERHCHTIPSLLHNQAALPNPNVCVLCRDAVYTIFSSPAL